jgi:hypothetical protein
VTVTRFASVASIPVREVDMRSNVVENVRELFAETNRLLNFSPETLKLVFRRVEPVSERIWDEVYLNMKSSLDQLEIPKAD